MPYNEKVFDIVVCTDVLEHVLDLNLACANILSVLKETGILLVRVPYREDLSQYVAPTSPYKYVHLRNFDEGSLLLLFERIFDCEVVEMTTAGYALSSTRLKCRLFNPKSGTHLARLPSDGHRGLAGSASVLLSRMRRIVRVFSVRTPIYGWLLRKLAYPVEINVIVKKKS
jgi:SAM-dependent methyltransferase